MTLFALLGSKGLYLLFIWLISAAAGAWLAERKGYGERVGLTFGLLLTALGLLIVLLLPGRPGSVWKEEGWIPKRRRHVVASGPVTAPLPSATTPPAAPPPDSPPPDAPAPGQASPPDEQ